MIVHLIDGTYELFRHFYGLRRFNKGEDRPFGAVTGVLHTVLQTIETGGNHLGVATDHVIESFRNGLWAGYKTGDGIEPALLAQFHPLEEALAAMGVVVWPMIELEADDALASAARIAAKDEAVERVCIWTPDKDLGQCVRGDRVVQVDRRGRKILDANGVRAKFGGRLGRRLSRHSRDRCRHRVPASQPIRQNRGISRHGAGGQPRPRATLQASGDTPVGRAPVRRCSRAAVARPHRRIRRVGGAFGRPSPAAPLSQGSSCHFNQLTAGPATGARAVDLAGPRSTCR